MRAIVVVTALLAASCSAAEGSDPDTEPVDWSPPDGKADGAIPSTFDRNDLIDDAMFTAGTAVTGDAIQAFLEATPYHTKSWLAGATLDGVRFADGLLAIGQADGIDPVVLLARLQGESSLVAATAVPTQAHQNAATGCGCPDGSACAKQDEGLSKQLHCAADTLAARFADSKSAASGAWTVGVTRNTLDPLPVTPANNATAALYAYTPWVDQNTGGNWLLWSISREYFAAFSDAGTLTLPP